MSAKKLHAVVTFAATTAYAVLSAAGHDATWVLVAAAGYGGGSVAQKAGGGRS